MTTIRCSLWLTVAVVIFCTAIAFPSPPSFLEPPLPLTVAEGDSSATFRCRAAGDPPPTAFWEKEGKGLHSSHKHKISSQGEEHSLTICELGSRDAGRYTCLLENSGGCASHSAPLTLTRTSPAPPRTSPAPPSSAGKPSPHPTDFRSVLRARTEPGRPRSLDRASWRTEQRAARHPSPSGALPSSQTSRRPSPPSLPPAPPSTGGQQVDFRSVLRRREEGGRDGTGGPRSKSQDRLHAASPSVPRGRSPQTGSAARAAAAKFQQGEVSSGAAEPAPLRGTRNAVPPPLEKPMTSVQSSRPAEQPAPPRLASPAANGSGKRFTALSGAAQPARGAVVGQAARQLESRAGGPGDGQGRRSSQQPAKSFLAAFSVFAGKPAAAQSASGSSHSSSSQHTAGEVRNFGSRMEARAVHANGTAAKAVGSNSLHVSSVGSSAAEDSVNSSSSITTSSSSEKGLDGHSSHSRDGSTLASKHVLSRAAPRLDRSPPRQPLPNRNAAPPVQNSPPSPVSAPSPPHNAASDLPLSPTPKSRGLLNSADQRRREAGDWRSRLAGRYEGRGLPEVRRPLSDQCVRYGCRAVLECEIAGVPQPEISWTVNQKTIKVSRFFQMSYEDNRARLVIAEAYSEDEGEYTCTASNPAGSTRTACQLRVQEPSSGSQSSHADFEGPVTVRPQLLNISASSISMVRGEPAEISVTFTGNPRPAITWLKGKEELHTDSRMSIRLTEYTSTLTISATEVGDTGSYNVLVSNCMGSDSASLSLTVEDVPEAPMGSPHITNVTPTSVSLAWYGPAFDGGSQVTHYAVEVKVTGRDVWRELTSSCESTSYEACGLDTDTEYAFRVRAGNKHGLGPPSQVSDSIMPRDHFDSESEDEPLPFEPRQVVISPERHFEDHYEILNEVGKGKFGSVFRCRSKEDGGEWAAKVVKALRSSERKAVQHEVDIMNQLAHPKLLLLRDAFSCNRSITLVMEYIGGGELFERVISEDFVLTERDCVHFMRQIVEGVRFMHGKSIMHLDLKPENILCISPDSNQVKIIDFGLARLHQPGTSLKVMFGTPEFIAPEVINYEEIGLATDMWSLGVICYVLLSGLSPFGGDSDAETLANVTLGDFDFEDEAFDVISSSAKNFIEGLLVKRKEKRMTIEECQRHKWLAQDERKIRCKRLNTDKLRHFMARRKWQKTGNAIRALGRLGLLAGGGGTPRSQSSASLDIELPSPSSSPRPPSPPHLSASLPKVNDDDDDEEEEEERRGSGVVHSPEDNNNGAGGHLGAAQPRESTHAARHQPRETTIATRQPRETTTASARREAGAEPQGEADSARSRPAPRRSLPQPPAHPPLPNGDVHRDERGALPDQREAGGGRGAGGSGSRRRLRFEKRMVDCKAFKGDAVRFDVTLSGAPSPLVQWLLDGEPVEEDACHLREEGSARGQHSLIIRHVTDEDDGEYTCQASADGETVSCSADLQVIGSGAF